MNTWVFFGGGKQNICMQWNPWISLHPDPKICTLDCLIHEQGLISAQGGIYQKINKRTGPDNCTGWKNFRDLKITTQGLIIAQGKNNYKEYM